MDGAVGVTGTAGMIVARAAGAIVAVGAAVGAIVGVAISSCSSIPGSAGSCHGLTDVVRKAVGPDGNSMAAGSPCTLTNSYGPFHDSDWPVLPSRYIRTGALEGGSWIGLLGSDVLGRWRIEKFLLQLLLDGVDGCCSR